MKLLGYMLLYMYMHITCTCTCSLHVYAHYMYLHITCSCSLHVHVHYVYLYMFINNYTVLVFYWQPLYLVYPVSVGLTNIIKFIIECNTQCMIHVLACFLLRGGTIVLPLPLILKFMLKTLFYNTNNMYMYH